VLSTPRGGRLLQALRIRVILLPPLCVTQEQVETCLKLLGEVVADVYEDVKA
jgi:hypothetical protein